MKCPNCNRKLDAHSSKTGERPIPGDISVCAYCREALAFTSSDGSTADGLRFATAAEQEEYVSELAGARAVLDMVQGKPRPGLQ